MKLSKTDFISYLDCPNNAWVKLHQPEEYNKFPLSEFEESLITLGNEVEELARGMFPSGYLVGGRSEHYEKVTKELISEKTPVIFQAIFTTDKFLAATDVMKWNEEAQAYDLYEIKISSTKEEETSTENDFGKKDVKEITTKIEKPKRNSKKEIQYDNDLAFQTYVLNECKVALNKKYLVRLNKEYIRHGKLNFTPNQLFIVEDKTEIINDMQKTITDEMEKAYLYLSKNEMPKAPCPCYYRGRNSHCTTFDYINPDVPKYSVHDLNRIGNSKKYLKELLDEGIIKIEDVPLDDRLRPKESKDQTKITKPKKLNQVQVHKSQIPIIDIPAIKEELSALTFPLYFLDYETSPAPIPRFDGYHPYQQIVFQYSLHVLRKPDAKIEHYECLILEDGDPAEKIAKSLRENIGDKGSIIVWYKNFENSRNRELAEMLPDYADFFYDVIKRTYDLMDIVENQHYVHPGFKGKSSIKKVQPILVPDLSYSDLTVKNGTDAIESYRQIITGELYGEERDKKEIEMLKYCENDTLVMVKLWEVFNNLIK